MINHSLLNSLLIELESHKIIKYLNNKFPCFYDEPQFYSYSVVLNNKPKYLLINGYNVKTSNAVCGGTSHKSRLEALTKCLCEASERLSLLCFKKQSIIYSTYSNLYKKALNPTTYINKNSIEQNKIGWITGNELITNEPCLIPAQLIYLNYNFRKDQIKLSTQASTGAACGFTPESALVRALYEVIERDAFMTTYLNKIKTQKIDVDHINNNTVQQILKTYRRYQLEPHIFDITSNLTIPVFMTILVDKTGNSPFFSIGTKSGLNTEEAILGSLIESYNSRIVIRLNMINKTVFISKHQKAIKTIDDRILFWQKPKMLNKFNFLLNQTPKKYKINQFKKTPSEELKAIKNSLIKNNLQAYNVDITLPIFQKYNLKVYKVIIPKLQPLYLDETQKELRLCRLKGVSQFFGQKKFKINQIPHPFL